VAGSQGGPLSDNVNQGTAVSSVRVRSVEETRYAERRQQPQVDHPEERRNAAARRDSTGVANSRTCGRQARTARTEVL